VIRRCCYTRAGLALTPGPGFVFEGFEVFDIASTGTTIHGRRGVQGPPVLLLHGNPETRLMWHRVAPRLAERFTVVTTDLRGFGDRGTPPSASDHAPYSMREIARDQVEVMNALGYATFSLVGHDRGARCAYRMALDQPRAVTHLAVLDIIPTGEVLARADMDFSLGFWVRSFIAAPEPVPEQLIAQAPAIIVNHMLDAWSKEPDPFSAEVRAAYIDQFRDPDTVHAICEQYRAAATLDYQHDQTDRGQRRITYLTLALWSHTGPVAHWYQPLQIWKAWSDEVHGGPSRPGTSSPKKLPTRQPIHLTEFLAQSMRRKRTQ